MAKSHLKWLGGKYQLLNNIIPLIPGNIKTWVEPFCGSCSVFFEIFGSEFSPYDRPQKAILNDINPILINCHWVVAHKLKELSFLLAEREKLHMAGPSEYYYSEREKVKDIKFDTIEQKIEAAALFIYINKACFNGLWRLNSSGGLNAAWNKKNQVKLNTSKLYNCSNLLREYAMLSCQSYEDIIEQNTATDDFFFLDPPYVPITNTASFVSYTTDGWDIENTKKLKNYCDLITERNQRFMLTNSNAPLVYELFGKYHIVEVDANRLVSVSADRPKVKETIIINYG